MKRPLEKPTSPFADQYPALAGWVPDGWVEIGPNDCSRSFVRALDEGGMVWEGAESYPTLEDAFAALDAGIKAFLEAME